MEKTKGFTLIELLIVVAIIAILAAIAVPNFLEAQVRAKVARVKNDQRNLATAVESYYIDYSTYPPNNNGTGGGDPTISSSSFQTMVVLSTPVAYIATAIIEDPFGNDCGLLGDGRSIIGYINSLESDNRANAAISAAPITNGQKRSLFDQGFWLTSAGPDRFTRVQEIAIANSGDCANVKAGDFVTLLAEIATNPPIYDPSNGTISSGDILRTRKGVFTPFTAGVGGL